jgi:glycosyltransferase involved in cell wall biosynthesis
MRTKKRALIILTPGFPENEQDSTCLPERQAFVKALQETYPHIQVIVLSFQYPFFVRHYKWNQCQVRSFNGRNKGKFTRRLVWLCVWIDLLRLRRQFHIEGLLSFWLGECALIGNRFAKMYGLKHYCCLLGQDAKANNRFVPLVRPGPDMLIAISDFLADEFFKNYLIRPRHIIPAGIDTRWFGKKELQREIDIIGVGSLIPLKQFDIWLKVVAKLVQVFPNLKATLIGKGPEMNRLIALAGSLGIENHVRFEGELPHEEVLLYMQRSRLLLHTSGYEGFGLVMTEALYAGCAVVSFCNPMKESIQNFYIAENTDQMIEKAIQLLPLSDHIPVTPYEVQDGVVKVMNLFSSGKN